MADTETTALRHYPTSLPGLWQCLYCIHNWCGMTEDRWVRPLTPRSANNSYKFTIKVALLSPGVVLVLRPVGHSVVCVPVGRTSSYLQICERAGDKSWGMWSNGFLVWPVVADWWMVGCWRWPSARKSLPREVQDVLLGWTAARKLENKGQWLGKHVG